MDNVDASLSELEQRIGRSFRHKDLLALALVHHSSGDPATDDDATAPSNERLEFLGDAVLGAAAAAFLYRAYPDLDEGALTTLRSALVRRSTVALYADELHLERFVYVAPAHRGPDDRGARSVLSAAFEAIVGAVYLDGGFTRAARFLESYFRRHLPLIVEANLHQNAKSALQEHAQGTYRVTPRYTLLDRSGPSHDSRFLAEVYVEGLGRAQGTGINRRAAEQAAARTMLATVQAARPEPL